MSVPDQLVAQATAYAQQNSPDSPDSLDELLLNAYVRFLMWLKFPEPHSCCNGRLFLLLFGNAALFFSKHIANDRHPFSFGETLHQGLETYLTQHRVPLCDDHTRRFEAFYGLLLATKLRGAYPALVAELCTTILKQGATSLAELYGIPQIDHLPHFEWALGAAIVRIRLTKCVQNDEIIVFNRFVEFTRQRQSADDAPLAELALATLAALQAAHTAISAPATPAPQASVSRRQAAAQGKIQAAYARTEARLSAELRAWLRPAAAGLLARPPEDGASPSILRCTGTVRRALLEDVARASAGPVAPRRWRSVLKALTL